MTSEGRWVCTACGGAYTVDGSRGDGSVVLRCSACGTEVRATLTIEAPPAVDASASPTSKRSASAMLDETPPSRAPLRLSLVSEQPILPPPKSVPPVAAAAPVAATEEKEEKEEEEEEEIEPVPLSSSALVDAPPSSRGVVEISSDELVDAPPSARDAVQAAREAVAKKTAHIELAEDDDGEESPVEHVSLADVQVVAKIPTPLPPKAGTLKTLPPSALSAPPPTIEVPPASGPVKKVEEPAAKVDAAKPGEPKKTPSVAPPKRDSTPPKKASASTEPPAKKKATESAAAKTPKAPAQAESQRPPSEESEGRSPLVWIAGAAAVVVAAWLGTRGSGTPTTSTAPTAEPSAATSPVSSTISSVTAAPAVSAAPTPSASGSSRVVDVPATELVSGAASGSKPAGEPGTSGRSTSDLLDRAAKARHAGDLAKARALYDRVLEMHPGDVEASSGLGELARMNGDLPGAKRHFQAALQAAPSFSPALLGLGDTLWELGEKHEASQVYARLVGARADVPERARERSQAGGAATRAPVPTVAPLPASALPPSPPAPEEGAN